MIVPMIRATGRETQTQFFEEAKISETETLNAILWGIGAPNHEKDAIFGFRGSSLMGSTG